MAKGRDNKNREEKKKKKPKKSALPAAAADIGFRHHSVVQAPAEKPEQP